MTIRVFSANHARDASTDANGAFRAEALQGCCVILLDKEGFADGTVRLPLQPGTDAAPLNLTMLPWPALSGRVINPERHAVGGSTVDAISLSWGAKWSTYCNARGYSDCKPASVGADGSFMLHVPLEYVLQATPATPQVSGATELAPTWFPDATERSDARPVLKGGENLSGGDIVLRRVKVFRVSGSVAPKRRRAGTGNSN